MIDMQRFFADDHIQGLEREAASLRAERARDERSHPASAQDGPAPDDVEGHVLDAAAVAGTPVPVAPIAATPVAPAAGVGLDHDGSPRVRLGRWVAGIGAAIAGSELEATPIASPIVADRK